MIINADTFLKYVSVVKMLYGRDVAEQVFRENIHKFIKNGYNLVNASLTNTTIEVKNGR